VTLTVLLLAGGKSRRMGVDKATMLIGGKPLWQRQIGVLNEVHPNALWVSAQDAPPWCPIGIDQVLDQPPSRGPLSGVVAALSRLRTSHLLVLAIDMPRMTAEHLRKLWSLARSRTGVIPAHNNSLEPLCAIYPANVLLTAETALEGRDWSLQSFCQELISRCEAQRYELGFDERQLYLNMNTPAELLAIESLGRP